MVRSAQFTPRKLKIYTRGDIDRIPQLRSLSKDRIMAMKAVAAVLPFRVNSYVVEELIDWNNVPDDPMYQLTFPQEGMLARADYLRMVALTRAGASKAKIDLAARAIQKMLNPHPAGQMELNVPRLGGKALPGMQHKYRETVLFFPMQGQTCHSYCTYCFRWAQFVGLDNLKFSNREIAMLAAYLGEHPEVSSILFTGGDPMIMSTKSLREYIEPLLDPSLSHVISIRIGTKALAYWPYRFLTDPDADDLLRLFESVSRAGKHLAIMAHYSHPRELDTPQAQAALRRVRDTGAVVRCQAPLIRHVNDNAKAWGDMWRAQIQLGCVPYYMFVERDTGAKGYFEVPLTRALDIFRGAYSRVSGLGRSARGPSMSATPGKVLVEGVESVCGEKVFVLKFLQARNPNWVNRVFFAKYDAKATWLDQLKPAFGEKEFFFDRPMRKMQRTGRKPAWGDEAAKRRLLTVYGNVEWE